MNATAKPFAESSSTPPPRLLDVVRDRLRLKHYSIRTEQQYVNWIRRFVLFHDKRHPREMGATEVSAFLTHLAVAGNVAASTQNQALSALLFLYREVLEVELPWLDEMVRAKQPRKLPVVLTRQEVGNVLDRMEGMFRQAYCGSQAIDTSRPPSAASNKTAACEGCRSLSGQAGQIARRGSAYLRSTCDTSRTAPVSAEVVIAA